VLLYLASPRIKDLAEMQESGVFLSDIALHDMTSDYVLLAEQRHAEADLKEQYEKLTLELKVGRHPKHPRLPGKLLAHIASL
jgi:guanylate cyclase soluble subunit beta